MVFKIIAEKFSEVQEDPLSSTLRHFIVKLQNIKERENPKGHRGIKHRLPSTEQQSDCYPNSHEQHHMPERNGISLKLRDNNYEPIILYQPKL